MHKINIIIDAIFPDAIRPTFANLTISMLDIGFTVQMVSISVSTAYCIWKWNKESKKKK